MSDEVKGLPNKKMNRRSGGVDLRSFREMAFGGEMPEVKDEDVTALAEKYKGSLVEVTFSEGGIARDGAEEVARWMYLTNSQAMFMARVALEFCEEREKKPEEPIIIEGPLSPDNQLY